MAAVAMSWIATANFIGWLAAAMTLLTFHCNDMLRLRLLALSAIYLGASFQVLPLAGDRLATTCLSKAGWVAKKQLDAIDP